MRLIDVQSDALRQALEDLWHHLRCESLGFFIGTPDLAKQMRGDCITRVQMQLDAMRDTPA